MAEPDKPSVDDALSAIRAMVPLLSSERVPIAEAGGRILAEDVRAVHDFPSFRASAMDGFACRSSELVADSLTIAAGEGPAGWSSPPLPPGQVRAISTGAPVPEGADRVVPYERSSVETGRFVVTSALGGSNIREIGEDMTAGSVVARRGTWIGPDLIGALAASGHANVTVRRWPRVGVLSNGTELGRDRPSQIPDSNGPMIVAQLSNLGLSGWRLATSVDDESALDGALSDFTDVDLIISTGGVSVGGYDLVRGALERTGARIIFHGIRMRPGKPILFAILRDGRPFLGLPGNPVAAFVGFRFFAFAALRTMLGMTDETGRVIAAPMSGRAVSTQFVRGRRALDREGQLTFDTDIDQRSHILSSVVEADCWLRVDENGVTNLFEKNASFH